MRREAVSRKLSTIAATCRSNISVTRSKSPWRELGSPTSLMWAISRRLNSLNAVISSRSDKPWATARAPYPAPRHFQVPNPQFPERVWHEPTGSVCQPSRNSATCRQPHRRRNADHQQLCQLSHLLSSEKQPLCPYSRNCSCGRGENSDLRSDQSTADQMLRINPNQMRNLEAGLHAHRCEFQLQSLTRYRRLIESPLTTDRIRLQGSAPTSPSCVSPSLIAAE